MSTTGPYRQGHSPELFLLTQQKRLDRLAEEGILATAIVSRFARTENFPLIGEEGVMIDLVVMVCPADRPAFPASFATAVALQRLTNYAPGQTIWVRYDRDEPREVDIDFEKQRGTTATV